jgi:hypothetical protein
MEDEYSLKQSRNHRNGQKYDLDIVKFVGALLRHKSGTAEVVGNEFHFFAPLLLSPPL